MKCKPYLSSSGRIEALLSCFFIFFYSIYEHLQLLFLTTSFTFISIDLNDFIHRSILLDLSAAFMLFFLKQTTFIFWCSIRPSYSSSFLSAVIWFKKMRSWCNNTQCSCTTWMHCNTYFPIYEHLLLCALLWDMELVSLQMPHAWNRLHLQRTGFDT